MSDDPAPALLTTVEGAVARLVLNRPRHGNSLSMDLVAALRAALADLAPRHDVKVIVLSGMGGRKPSQLSGGQIGRAALARALLRARPILLLDEPFAALGPALKAEMLDLVTETANETGATVLMVTHDPADARRFAEATVLVANGVAAAPQPTTDLFANPPAALREYLGT